jgi:hypothetical protein
VTIRPVFLCLATIYAENVLENEIVLSCPVVFDADRANLELYSVVNQGWVAELLQPLTRYRPSFTTSVTTVYLYRWRNRNLVSTNYPVWQHHAVQSPLVNFNLLTISDVADVFATVTSTLEAIKAPVASNLPFRITRNDEESDEESFSWSIHPVHDDGDVVGLVSA